MNTLDDHLLNKDQEEALIKDVSFQKRIKLFSYCNLILSISSFLGSISSIITFLSYLSYIEGCLYLLFSGYLLISSYLLFQSFKNLQIFNKNINEILFLEKGVLYFYYFIKSSMIMFLISVITTPIIAYIVNT